MKRCPKFVFSGQPVLPDNGSVDSSEKNMDSRKFEWAIGGSPNDIHYCSEYGSAFARFTYVHVPAADLSRPRDPQAKNYPFPRNTTFSAATFHLLSSLLSRSCQRPNAACHARLHDREFNFVSKKILLYASAKCWDRVGPEKVVWTFAELLIAIASVDQFNWCMRGTVAVRWSSMRYARDFNAS